MPSAFQVKQYKANSFYHVYNRGAQGISIFKEKSDYWIFRRIVRILEEKSDIKIDTFALLPTHFHLLLYQQQPRSLSKFMHSLGVRYTLFFNRKYKKSGRLCEERYKAILLETPEDHDRVREYIHNNPINKGFLTWKHVGKKI